MQPNTKRQSLSDTRRPLHLDCLYLCNIVCLWNSYDRRLVFRHIKLFIFFFKIKSHNSLKNYNLNTRYLFVGVHLRQQTNAFHMRCLAEHIHALHGTAAVSQRGENGGVARLGGRVAGNVYDFRDV